MRTLTAAIVFASVASVSAQADVAVVSDTGMRSLDEPAVMHSLRGMCFQLFPTGVFVQVRLCRCAGRRDRHGSGMIRVTGRTQENDRRCN